MAAGQSGLDKNAYMYKQLDRCTDKAVPSNSGGKKMLDVRNAFDSETVAVDVNSDNPDLYTASDGGILASAKPYGICSLQRTGQQLYISNAYPAYG